jgi:chromosome segregation ATPase
MDYKEIQHEIEYINLKNKNYDLKKELLLKDYNLNIKENRINKLLNELDEINYKYKDLKTELELCNKHYNNAINNIRNLNIKIRNKNNIIMSLNKIE